ncbi:MAG: acyl CoA:acetate/3-ketoacid CoA transferase [Coprococcus sp.]
MAKIMTAAEAIHTFIKDGDTVAFNGFVGAAHAEEVTKTMQEEFLATGSPRDLTVLYAAGMGDSKDRQLNHLAEEGLCSCVIGGHWSLEPRMQKLALENKFAAYNIPQGVVSQLYREIAAKRPGLITHVGLKTFVDPRIEGGKLNDKAREKGDIVQVVNINGQEKLFYPSIPVNVSIVRATYADTHGNCTLEKEGVFADVIPCVQAAKTNGGYVIVQVEKVVEYGSLDTRLVQIPGIYVDAIVVAKPENHMQTNGSQYKAEISGEKRIPMDAIPPMPMSDRKIIARRCAMELKPNAVVNLGIGMPEGIAAVAAEEGIGGMCLTTESGTIGGTPASGGDFGVTINPDCVLHQSFQFDFYDGGGLDIAFLGLAQCDEKGNINVSKFGTKVAGCGGFINITQNTPVVIFCGTFTAKGKKKFIKQVEQVTFSADYAKESGQKVFYVTERAVFKLTEEGVELTEVAPGYDLQKDILDMMDFTPIMKDVKTMDERIFKDELMGLGK